MPWEKSPRYLWAGSVFAISVLSPVFWDDRFIRILTAILSIDFGKLVVPASALLLAAVIAGFICQCQVLILMSLWGRRLRGGFDSDVGDEALHAIRLKWGAREDSARDCAGMVGAFHQGLGELGAAITRRHELMVTAMGCYVATLDAMIFVPYALGVRVPVGWLVTMSCIAVMFIFASLICRSKMLSHLRWHALREAPIPPVAKCLVMRP